MATSGDISSAAAKRKPLTGVAEFIQSFRLFFIGEPGERPWFNLLLVFVPLSIASRIAEWSPTAQFVLSLFAMMPLAERLGFTTESLADHTNDTIGGLMNATMGNLPELIVALFALKDGLLRVVQTSLLGSILSNLLLVMGMAYLVGGIRYKEQTFNKIQTHTGSALLIVSVIAMILPAVLQATNTEAVEHQSELNLSRAVSIVMILTYIALMVFQLRTHAHLYNDADDDDASTATGTAAGGEEGEAQSLVHAAEAGLVVEDCAVADSDKPSRTVDSAITSTNTAASMVTSASDDVTASCHATIAIKAPVVDSSSSSSSSDGVLDSPTASVVVDVEAAATTPLAPVPDAAAAASRGASSRSLGAAAGTGLQSARAVSAASAGASTGAEAVAAGRQNEAASSVVAATPHHDGPPLSVFSSIFWMAAVAALIAGLSEIIVASIEQFAQQTGLPDAFVSTILLPIAGNAAEHASAIIFAHKNRLDIALGVAVGSSIQIALFVTPFCVLVGWMMGQPLDLNFYVFETVVMFLTIIIAAVVNMEGKVNWLQGLLLLMTYVIVGAAFLLHAGEGPVPEA